MTHSRSSAAERYFTCLTAHFFAGLIYACNYTPGATIGWICNWIQMVFCSTWVTADRYLLVRKLTSLLSHGTATNFLFFYFFWRSFVKLWLLTLRNWTSMWPETSVLLLSSSYVEFYGPDGSPSAKLCLGLVKKHHFFRLGSLYSVKKVSLFSPLFLWQHRLLSRNRSFMANVAAN